VPNWQLAAHALLAVVAGLSAPLFLLLLRGGESVFSRVHLPVSLKLAWAAWSSGRSRSGNRASGARLRRGRERAEQPLDWQALMTILV